MRTLKRLILLEATFKKIDTYTGKIDSDFIILHSCQHLVNQLKGGAYNMSIMRKINELRAIINEW